MPVLDDLVVRLSYRVRGAAQIERGLKRVSTAVTRLGQGAQRVGTQLATASGRWGRAFQRMAQTFRAATNRTKRPVEEQTTAVGLLTRAWRALIGLAVVGWARAQGQELMDLGTQASNLAAEFGGTEEQMQALQYAATDASIPLEQLLQGMRSLQRQTVQAGIGLQESVKNFQLLGVSAKDLQGLDPAGKLGLVADALLQIEDPGRRAGVAMRLLGGSGSTLLPLLNQGSAGLARLTDEFRALGGGLSGDAIRDLAGMERALKRLDAAVLATKSQLVLLLVPAVTSMVDAFRRGTSWITRMDKSFHILRVGGIALMVAGLAKLLTVLNAVGAARLFTGALGIAKWLAIAAAIAAVAVLIDDLAVALNGGRSLIANWIDSWAGLGTVDKWVRNIRAGIKAIQEEGLGRALTEAVSGFGSATQRPAAPERLAHDQARLAQLQALPPSAFRDQEIARVRERISNTARDPGTQLRAVARGVAGDVQGLGEVTEGRLSRQALNVTTHVTVNARTGADAREIGREAARAARAETEAAARRISSATRRGQ